MNPQGESKLESRVIRAAEAALAHHQYVSAIDVLTGMQLLAPSHVDDWRRGRLPFLEQMILGNPNKIAQSLAIFRRWAESKGLKPSETPYQRGSRDGIAELQFSQSGHPEIEKVFRTHYISPVLSERK